LIIIAVNKWTLSKNVQETVIMSLT